MGDTGVYQRVIISAGACLSAQVEIGAGKMSRDWAGWAARFGQRPERVLVANAQFGG